jgi:hypothetical protein
MQTQLASPRSRPYAYIGGRRETLAIARCDSNCRASALAANSPPEYF